jgi:hypothetical protein
MPQFEVSIVMDRAINKDVCALMAAEEYYPDFYHSSPDIIAKR